MGADGIHSKSRDHSRTRKKHKHRSKKERKRQKKERKRKEKERKNKQNHSGPTMPSIEDSPPSPHYFDQNRDYRTQSMDSKQSLTARLSQSGRPIPPPPPKTNRESGNSSMLNKHRNSQSERQLAQNTDIENKKPPPPQREQGRSRKYRESENKKKKRERDRSHSRKRKKNHEKSQSENVDLISLSEKRKKKKNHEKKTESVDVVDFVPINVKYGGNSPTLSESRTLFDHLKEIELDVETPSDEESLIYVQEDDLVKPEDSDIDEEYDWNTKKTNTNKKNKKNNKITKKTKFEEEEEDEVSDDDISILSTQKMPGIDDEDLGDSEYSAEDEDDYNSSEAMEEENENDSENELDGSSSVEIEEVDEENLSKQERKRRKNERKRKKAEKKKRRKERKKERKRKEKEKKKLKKQEKKNSTSMNEILSGNRKKKNSASIEVINTHRGSRSGSKVKMGSEDDKNEQLKDDDFNQRLESAKKRTTITGKIKKIGNKFKFGLKGNDSEKDKDKEIDLEVDRMENDKIAKVDDPFNRNYGMRTNANKENKNSSLSIKDMFKSKSREIGRERAESMNSKAKKKRFGIRGFKTRKLMKTKGNDDNLVDYGDRNEVKRKRKKPRRGSDSNLSYDIKIDPEPWFEEKRDKKKRKRR